MREPFGTRGTFHSYPIIVVLIKSIGYSFPMVHFVLALNYYRGRHFEGLVAYSVFLIKQNSKTKKTGLHEDIPCSYN